MTTTALECATAHQREHNREFDQIDDDDTEALRVWYARARVLRKMVERLTAQIDKEVEPDAT